MAENRAKELAEKLAQGSESFVDFFEAQGIEVLEQTDLFSWETFGLAGQAGGGPPQVSVVAGLNNIGSQFMQAVFGLAEDEAAGVLNFDQTEAYVVQVATRERTKEELQQLFLATDIFNQQARFAMMRQHRNEFDMALGRQLIERANLDISPWQTSRLENPDRY